MEDRLLAHVLNSLKFYETFANVNITKVSEDEEKFKSEILLMKNDFSNLEVKIVHFSIKLFAET